MKFHVGDLVTDGRKGTSVESRAEWQCPGEKAFGRNTHHGDCVLPVRIYCYSSVLYTEHIYIGTTMYGVQYVLLIVSLVVSASHKKRTQRGRRETTDRRFDSQPRNAYTCILYLVPVVPGTVLYFRIGIQK